MQSNDTSKKVTIYSNAIQRKYHNKRVALSKKDNNYYLQVSTLVEELVKPPVVWRTPRRGKAITTVIEMSKETLEAFVMNAIELLEMEDEAVTPNF